MEYPEENNHQLPDSKSERLEKALIRITEEIRKNASIPGTLLGKLTLEQCLAPKGNFRIVCWDPATDTEMILEDVQTSSFDEAVKCANKYCDPFTVALTNIVYIFDHEKCRAEVQG